MFSLNAWFERSQPILELRNNYTKKVVLRLKGERLQKLLQDCDFTCDDLMENQSSKDLIRTLLLVSIEDFPVCGNVKQKLPSNIINFPNVMKQKINFCNYSNNVVYMNRLLINLTIKKV